MSEKQPQFNINDYFRLARQLLSSSFIVRSFLAISCIGLSKGSKLPSVPLRRTFLRRIEAAVDVAVVVGAIFTFGKSCFCRSKPDKEEEEWKKEALLVIDKLD